MRVYVVMGNDYPDAVFATELLAEAYCLQRAAERKDGERKIYWRHYDFELLQAIPTLVPQ